MKHGFRQSMAWLHTWSGLIVGWVLFAVFLTGTAAYLRPEITAWMRPELPIQVPAPVDEGRDAQVIIDHMARVAPGAPVWFITLPDTRQSAAAVFWRDPAPGGRGFRDAWLDPWTGEPLAVRDTLGGEFFYRFHFQLDYMNALWGRWIISFCAMCMLVAIISGIVTHKRIFADFFTFRPGASRRAWLDGHAAAAVLALPYHLMITYTGLVTLIFMTMPWGGTLAYKGDRAAFGAEVLGIARPARPSGHPAPLVPIAPLLEQARQHWNGGSVGRINVQNPGDAGATIQLVRDDAERLSYAPQILVFDGVTGALRSSSDDGRPAAETRGVMYGLHVARFAGPWLRGLFVLSGLLGTAMVATGCVLWAQKTRQAAERHGRPGPGLWLVEHLNVAAIGGLPVAMAAYFWANRLLPTGLAHRPDWEVNLFFATWALCLAHPLFRARRQAWVEQFAAAGLLFGLLPVLNALTTDAHLGVTLPAGSWHLAGFDLGFLAIGLGFTAISRAVARHVPAAKRGRSREPALAAAGRVAAE